MATTRGAFSGRALAAALALTVAAHARGAEAQTAAEIAGRRELLNQAQAARDAGRHAEALEFAERAQSLGGSPSVRLFIAEEQMALNHSAEALGEGELALREATAQPTLANRETLIARARGIITAASAHVGRLVVRVPAGVADTAIRVNGRPLARAFWNAPSIVTPGAVVVEAGAPGHQSERHDVNVGQGQSVTVELQLLAADAAPVGAPLGTARAPALTPPAPAPRMVRSPVGLIVGSVGAAVFFTGLGFGVAASTTYRGLEEGRTRCPGPADCNERADRVETFGLVGTIGMAAGGVLAATGTVLFFVVKRPEARAAQESNDDDRARLWIGPQGVGATVAF